MLITLLPFVSLMSVPAIMYLFSGMCAFANLLIIVPKFFTRSVIQWPDYSLSTQTSSKYEDPFYKKYYTDGFCNKGERMFPENGTVYLQSSLTSGDSVKWMDRCWKRNHFDNPEYASSLVDQISQSFETVVMDCPELKFSNRSDDCQDLSRAIKHLKWIAAYNSQVPPKRSKLTVKFRFSTYENNAIRFDDLYCVALAVAANQLHPGTVTGFLLNSDIISPLVTLKTYRDWETLTSVWKKRLGKFGLSMGLMLSWSSCLRVPKDASLTKVLSKFDEIYYFRDGMLAMSNYEPGVNWFVSKKFLECRNVFSWYTDWVGIETVKVRDVVEDLYLRFTFRSDKICIIYY